MSLLTVRAELEEERTWRADEIRLLQNQANALDSETQRDQFRRTMLLMLYAHFEGFCGAALRVYVREVNSQGLRMRQVTPAVAAATCRPILMALSDSNRKNDFFRRRAPDDPGLHFAWRSQEFLSRLSEILDSTVQIPDSVVDTESNLWPIVLKKNLFRLGFGTSIVDEHEATIANLVNRRNNIAHGMERGGIAEGIYTALQKSVYEVMDEVTLAIATALSQQAYLITAAASEVSQTA